MNKHKEKPDERIADAAESIASSIKDLAKFIKNFLVPQALGFNIYQIMLGIMQADIKGILLGQVGTFTGVPTPAGGLTSGVPSWSADDPNVSLTPSADGSSVSVATSATDTAPSFNLKQSGADGLGNPISSSVNVPLLPSAPPPVQAVGFDIRQVS
jgi:hypothetical protein